jgi:predicted lipoprotein with Yx(FWY)xxD motif
MHRTLAALPAIALLAVAGCGSGSSSTTGSSASSSSPTSSAAGAIHVASTSLGQVLVDGAGRTVYLLTADSPGKSSCDASCLMYWPAVGAPASGTSLPGVTAKMGQASTPGGARIVTVGGWPLYTFVKDKAAGDVTGEGVQSFGGTWYAVSPSGQPVKAGGGSSSTPGGGSSSGSSGGGLGY